MLTAFKCIFQKTPDIEMLVIPHWSTTIESERISFDMNIVT